MRGEHRRVIRAIGVALLKADFTAKDLRRFADDLNSYEIRMALEHMIKSLSEAINFDNDESKFSLSTDNNDSEETLYEFVQRKRLSRARILAAFSSVVSPSFASSLANSTVKEMTEKFSRSHHSKIEDFKQFIDKNRGDPYLIGIMGRKSK